MTIPSAWIGAVLARTTKLPDLVPQAPVGASTKVTTLPKGANLPEESVKQTLPYLKINRTSSGKCVTAAYYTEGLVPSNSTQQQREFCAWCDDNDIPYYTHHQFFEHVIICGITHLDDDDVLQIEMKWK